ncbi:MAG: hypothetical protein EHM23_20065 [Acidobacteria bacterium]|nr:MAG: hypothetical protein EHM23_20065 [Acidobacteriota bacterium]
MEIIENVLGRGTLIRREGTLGEVTYDLIVFRRGEETGVAGRFSCSLECLIKAHQAHRLTLQLVDGRQLKIVIDRVHFRTQTADFNGIGWFF